MPVPGDPYLDTALSRRQATSAAGKRAPTGMWGGAAPAAPHGTAPVRTPARSTLPAVIALCPGIWPQHSQPQSFMSPSLPGPIPLQFLRDFLNGPFPISSLLGRGLDKFRAHWFCHSCQRRNRCLWDLVRIPSIRPHKTFSGLLIGKKMLFMGSRHEPSVAGRYGLLWE